jgi:hypothetical protein
MPRTKWLNATAGGGTGDQHTVSKTVVMVLDDLASLEPDRTLYLNDTLLRRVYLGSEISSTLLVGFDWRPTGDAESAGCALVDWT